MRVDSVAARWRETEVRQPLVGVGMAAAGVHDELGLKLLCLAPFASKAASPPARRWRGNLHTHSLWSDGDDYLEMIGLWYRDHGYDFLCFTDHNVLAASERWIDVEKSKVYRKFIEIEKSKQYSIIHAFRAGSRVSA